MSEVYNKHWSISEDREIERLLPVMKPEEIAEMIGRTEQAVKQRCRRLGLSIKCDWRKRWTRAEELILVNMSKKQKNAISIAEVLGRTPRSVRSHAGYMGVKLTTQGERAGNCKYSSEDIALVKKLRAEGLGRTEISKKMEIPLGYLNKIIDGKSRVNG